MKTQTKLFYIKDELTKKIQKHIDDNTRMDDQIQKDEKIKEWVFNFSKKIFATITVYDSDNGPWIDAVLFDRGNEAVLIDPQYVLLGDYPFEYHGTQYVIQLR